MKVKDFCLPDSKGEKHCLSDYKGKWIVLYFYPKDNTSGCTAEAVEFSKLNGEFKKLNAVIIGISKDSAKSHEKFIEKNNLKILLLSDTEKKVLQQFGAWGKKKMCGRECMGTIRSTFLISPEFKIVKEWRNVKAKGHAEAVFEYLKSLIE